MDEDDRAPSLAVDALGWFALGVMVAAVGLVVAQGEGDGATVGGLVLAGVGFCAAQVGVIIAGVALAMRHVRFE